MGQSVSNTSNSNDSSNNKKIKKKNNSNRNNSSNSIYESIIFGYIKSYQTIYFKQNDKDDNLLFKPFLYGLENKTIDINSCSQTKEGALSSKSNRTDSGFLLCEKDGQLWKDLIYIDQTYYSKSNTNYMEQQKQQQKQQQQQVLITGNGLTLNDLSISYLQDIDLSRRRLGSLSSNIGLLSMIKKLDISHNHLQEIPLEIGYLQHLEILNLSHNQLTSIPDTICHLTQLTEFNLAHNQITTVTPYIGHLKKLQSLILSHNQLKELTVAVEGLQSCTLLDISYNPTISILPAEIIQLPFLRRLRLDGCAFSDDGPQQFKLAHNPPSLVETCARHIVRHRHSALPLKDSNGNTILTDQLNDYISSYKLCSHCHGPYFDSYVSRGRWIEKNDTWVPLEYRLCSAHWVDESDRLLAMFSSSFSSVLAVPAPAVKKSTTSTTRGTPLRLLTATPPMLKPELPSLVMLNNSSSCSSGDSGTRKEKYTKSCFKNSSSCNNGGNSKRRSSTAAATDVVIPATAMVAGVVVTAAAELLGGESDVNTIESIDEENSTSSTTGHHSNSNESSTAKRWRFKVRNNSSLFLKNHILC